jgi:hypothetical protein
MKYDLTWVKTSSVCVCVCVCVYVFSFCFDLVFVFETLCYVARIGL